MKFKYLLTYLYHIKEVCLLNVKYKRRTIFKDIHKSYTYMYQNQVPLEVVDMEFDISICATHTIRKRLDNNFFFSKRSCKGATD